VVYYTHSSVHSRTYVSLAFLHQSLKCFFLILSNGFFDATYSFFDYSEVGGS
jgi:hypothetical protein